MKLYRSIGDEELNALLNGQRIYGKYNCSKEKQNTNRNYNACCFFVDEIRWKDANHKFLIVIDFPEDELDFGVGEYFAPPSLRQTKTWSGRTGSWIYRIREAYALSYSLENVKEIFLFNVYADWYINKCIKPVCEKHNIICHYSTYDDSLHQFVCKTEPFMNSSQKFIQAHDEEHGIVYVTTDYSKNWVKEAEITEKEYIEKIKRLVLNSDLTLTQARQIKSILN